MDVVEISLVPWIIALMICGILASAFGIAGYNYRQHKKFKFSVKQLLIFLTLSSLICIAGGFLIRMSETVKIEKTHESKAVINTTSYP